MATINFSAISIPDIEGNVQTFSISKELGMKIYMQGQTAEECELGKVIYHFEGNINLTEKQVMIVKKFISHYAYIVRTSIEKQLEQGEQNNE